MPVQDVNATVPALVAPPVIMSPGVEYAADTRCFQGVPAIERAKNGRLWAAWYGGGRGEGPDNYVMLVTSGNDGKTWSGLRLVIAPRGFVRAFDPCLWHDPTGRLWLFWAQTYEFWDVRAGVWAITSDNSTHESATWSKPRRICDGIMLNKPTVLTTGEWVLPVAVWPMAPGNKGTAHDGDATNKHGCKAYSSTDNGATWRFLGQADADGRNVDEHMIVERNDATLWMLIRTKKGIAESFSTDRGRTWSYGRKSPIDHVDSRFFIRRLRSGNLLMVKHAPPDMKARSHLKAFVSEDDGATWHGGLLLDQRVDASYPDGVEAPDGTIYVTYDYSRSGEKLILMATFTEKDALRGKRVSDRVRLRVTVNQATGGNTK